MLLGSRSLIKSVHLHVQTPVKRVSQFYNLTYHTCLVSDSPTPRRLVRKRPHLYLRVLSGCFSLMHIITTHRDSFICHKYSLPSFSVRIYIYISPFCHFSLPSPVSFLLSPNFNFQLLLSLPISTSTSHPPSLPFPPPPSPSFSFPPPFHLPPTPIPSPFPLPLPLSSLSFSHCNLKCIAVPLLTQVSPSAHLGRSRIHQKTKTKIYKDLRDNLLQDT